MNIANHTAVAAHAPLSVPVPALVLVNGFGHVKAVPLRGTVVIGRSPGAGVTIRDAAVSCFHCVVFPAMLRSSPGGKRGADWFLCDMGSLNGTYLNGARVREPVRLADRDVIQLGRTQTVEVRLKRRSAGGERAT